VAGCYHTVKGGARTPAGGGDSGAQ
jgi:hypothetical protein